MLVIAAGLLKDWSRLVWQVSARLEGDRGWRLSQLRLPRSITDQVCPHYSPGTDSPRVYTASPSAPTDAPSDS